MNEKAMQLAHAHLQKMNPSLWNGTGEKPDTCNPIIYTHEIDENTELDISFEKDPSGEWLHVCELRDKDSETLLEVESNYGIASEEDIAKTIQNVCKGYI